MGHDDLVEDIREKLKEGIEVTAEDFEGQRCAYCGELVEFVEVQQNPEALVEWDVPVQGLEDDEPTGMYSRRYFCSEECKDDAQRDIAWIAGDKERYGEDYRLHEDELEGNR